MQSAPADPRPVGGILVVDDDPAVRKLIGMAFVAHGFSCQQAENGREARRLLDREPYRLVITDIFMPDCDGLELLAYCRTVRPGVPVIAISGGSALGGIFDTLQMARLLGCRDTLEKPLSISGLLSSARRLLGEAG